MGPENEVRRFEQTCDKPYDRHHYVLVLKTGQTYTYEDYEGLRLAWFQSSRSGNLSHVIVTDAVPAQPKGFK